MARALLSRQAAHIHPVHQHGALLHIVKAADQIDEGRLARAARPDESHHLPGRHVHRHIAQHRCFAVVGETHVLKIHAAGSPLGQAQRVLGFGRGVVGLEDRHHGLDGHRQQLALIQHGTEALERIIAVIKRHGNGRELLERQVIAAPLIKREGESRRAHHLDGRREPLLPSGNAHQLAVELADDRPQAILLPLLEIEGAHLALGRERLLHRLRDQAEAREHLAHLAHHALAHQAHQRNEERGNEQIAQQHRTLLARDRGIDEVGRRRRERQRLNDQVVEHDTHLHLHLLGVLHHLGHQITAAILIEVGEGDPLQMRKELHAHAVEHLHAGERQQIGVEVGADAPQHHGRGNRQRRRPQQQIRRVRRRKGGVQPVGKPLRWRSLPEDNRKGLLQQQRQQKARARPDDAGENRQHHDRKHRAHVPAENRGENGPHRCLAPAAHELGRAYHTGELKSNDFDTRRVQNETPFARRDAVLAARKLVRLSLGLTLRQRPRPTWRHRGRELPAQSPALGRLGNAPTPHPLPRAQCLGLLEFSLIRRQSWGSPSAGTA